MTASPPPAPPWLIDLVHHNPGEVPFDTAFTDPAVLADLGFNGQCFKHLNTVLRLPNCGGQASAPEEEQWLSEFRAARQSEVRAAAREGMSVWAHVDLAVLPKRIVEARRGELCDGDGTISFARETTRFVHRELFDELFEQFPEVTGIVPRIGETYLFDTPFHSGNSAVRYAGTEPREEEIAGFIDLLRFLREEICCRHGRWLLHRTWDTHPNRFHANPDFYVAVTDAVEPHPRLIFSIKHTRVDFHRYAGWNPCLGTGQHPQIVEVQCQREYEGKGAYPNYIARCVIDGFPEDREPGGMRIFSRDERYRGLFTWTRGGGWHGPQVTRANEVWPLLNAAVLARWSQAPERSEEELFFSVVNELWGAGGHDARLLREIAILSEEVVRKGKCCEAWDTRPGSEHDNYPTNQWMRDDVMEGMAALGPVFEYLQENDLTEQALAEKDQAAALARRMEACASDLSLPDHPEVRDALAASCAYGARFFTFVAQAWRALARDPAESRSALDAWEEFQRLPAAHPAAAGLYRDCGWHWPGKPPAPGLLDELRRLADKSR